jgi:SAM-dependent methyltransferase
VFDFLRYDFGYGWYVGYGHVVPLALAGALGAAALWRGWPRCLAVLCGVVVLWAALGVVITQALFRINLPVMPPSGAFLASGRGRVLDAGAGSGRAAIGLLLARPHVRVTALDLYRGQLLGVDDPELVRVNARVAGVADRIDDVVAGDLRDLPFGDATFDGVVSVAAIDHVDRGGIPAALGEVARVLKPGGELMLTIVSVDGWSWLASPHAIAHHRPVDPAWWRARLEEHGLAVAEPGTQPSALYFLARKAVGAR